MFVFLKITGYVKSCIKSHRTYGKKISLEAQHSNLSSATYFQGWERNKNGITISRMLNGQVTHQYYNKGGPLKTPGVCLCKTSRKSCSLRILARWWQEGDLKWARSRNGGWTGVAPHACGTERAARGLGVVRALTCTCTHALCVLLCGPVLQSPVSCAQLLFLVEEIMRKQT